MAQQARSASRAWFLSILLQEEPGPLGEMADARAGAGEVQSDPQASRTRKEGSTQKNKGWEHIERKQESASKEFPWLKLL